MTHIEVLVCKTRTGRRLFTYACEFDLVSGDIVMVEFGKKIYPAIAMGVVNKPTFKTKFVVSKTEFRLAPKTVKLVRWMINFYPDDFGAIGSQFIPANINTKARDHQPKTLSGLSETMPQPTTQQQSAINEMARPTNKKLIIHGATGTGKTLVFTHQILNTLNSGKSVLVITPEIGLTPQLALDIQKHITGPIVVSHSGLGPAERRRVWEYAKNHDQPTVFIGPRSALFLPFTDLGLVVIDEFHDQSLKQNSSPRYQSLHVASKLADIYRAKLILSSATPNVSDLYMMNQAGYKTLVIDQLAVSNMPATGYMIDTSDRQLFSKSKYIADDPLLAIAEALKNNEQVLVFLNRRGSARLVKCNSCGWQANCPHCGLPLTYHHDKFTLVCHSCGYKQKSPQKCPDCSEVDITYKSIGTKALVEHVEKLFPSATVARFDADSTGSDQLHRNIELLKNGSADIIVGTQIISKGIDLPKLSVVVVVNADSALAFPDYSAEENLFQQLYQVTGRVGRGHRQSKFFIQTSNPEHPLLQAVLNRDYNSFYKYETSKRHQFHYPPFSFLATVSVTKKLAKTAETKASKIANELAKNPAITTLGPSPSFYEKTPAGYAWQIVIKAKKRSEILKSLNNIKEDCTIDIDPISLL